jgi:tetratricopeptide (TPR) repeat protein
MRILTAAFVALALLSCDPTRCFAGPQDVTAQVAVAEKLMQEGDVHGAVQSLDKIVVSAPRSFEARLALGRALDLSGRHRDARLHLEEAVKLAPEDERNDALTALGISYAFEAKPDEAARYYQRVFDAHVQADDRASAAAVGNALGRIYLESGDLAKAEEWYRTGHETARDIPGQPPARLALWDMRWHNAMGRIEARRGNKAAAMKHAAEAKALLDKGGNDNQRPFYPYLLGYIAFYTKDYKQAIEELSKGDLDDSFVLGLIARAHQQLGNRTEAMANFKKVLASPSHTINAAFAWPAAQRFVKEGGAAPPRRRAPRPGPRPRPRTPGSPLPR